VPRDRRDGGVRGRQGRGTRDEELGTWNLELGTWNLELGTWNLELGTWNLELGTWTLELGAWNLELGAWNLELGAWNRFVAGHSDVRLVPLARPGQDAQCLRACAIRMTETDVPPAASRGGTGWKACATRGRRSGGCRDRIATTAPHRSKLQAPSSKPQAPSSRFRFVLPAPRSTPLVCARPSAREELERGNRRRLHPRSDRRCGKRSERARMQ
jgi:hypothetical protein